MATISGRIIFDRNRSTTIDAGDSGIANVPVVLQNAVTNVGLVVLTDANGNYSFINVPIGSYRIVEAFGTAGGVATPGDFNTAVVIPIPIGTNPPLSFATNPPPGATNLDSLTPDTLLVNVIGDLTNENFLDGPVRYTPIQTILDSCTTVSNINLITDADNGTFGSFLPGTPANIGPATAPYPSVTPDFTYVIPDPSKFTPIDGEYTVQNIMSDAMSNVIGAWWRIADHTVGNETGRMMVVNGFDPGAVFFRSTVSVTPNTNFLFSTWILNLFKVTGFPPAELGVRILDQNNNVIFQQTLGVEIPVNVNEPEWKQIGTVINSLNNTQLTVEFFSEGVGVVGNDYAIDDVSLQEIIVPTFVPVKSSSATTANIGDIVTYTVRLTNTCTRPLTNVFFEDILPLGLEFENGSVTINGLSDAGADPNIGFDLPDIPGGTTTEVIFQVRVEGVPNPNPAINTATIDYSYTPVEGGIPLDFSEESNEVPLLVEQVPGEADIAVVKSSNQATAIPGEEFTYTIEITNFGLSDSENVILTDIIPVSILNPEFSVNGGTTFNPWSGSLNLGTIEGGGVRVVLIRGIISQSATGVISNTATVSSTTPDPNPSNNTSTLTVPVSTVEEEADISVVKTVSSNQVAPGSVLSYTLVVSNAGPDAAENVVVNDNISPSIIGPEFSIDGGVTFNPWIGFFDIGTVPAGASRTILIRGTVSETATGCINNAAIVVSTTPDPNMINNISSVCVEVETVVPLADVSVVKSATPNPVAPGGVITYTLSVANAGPNDAQNVVLTDSIPPSIIGPEFSIDGGLIFNPWTGSLMIGNLPVGSNRTILISGTVSQSAIGNIINTANVTSTTLDPNPFNNSFTVETEVALVVGEADISVVKTASPNPVNPGGTVTFTVVVSNSGPSAAESVVLTDNVSSSIIGPEFSTDGGVIFNPWLGTLNIGTLQAGASRTILIRGTVSPLVTGCINNTAIVTSSTPDPNPSNNVSSICIDVSASPEADISVVKTASANKVKQGEILTYTIVVSNAGPSVAENVILIDNVSDSIVGTEFSVNGGGTFNPWLGNLNIGVLPAGVSRTILIRGAVSPSATGCVANAASVTSTTPDPNLLNNTSAICVEVKKSADIAVEKKCTVCEERSKNTVTFKIKVSNLGPSTARNVVVEDKIPSGIVDVKFSIGGIIVREPWTGSFDIGTLKAGESITIILEGILKQNCKRKICNTAKVRSTTFDPDLSNNTSSVVIKAVGYNSHKECHANFECFECDSCDNCDRLIEERDFKRIRYDF